MINPTLTNEMKSHAVIVALKGDRRDLEIARFLRVERSFIHKINKELEKENDNVSILKRKNIPHFPIQCEYPNLFIKLSSQLIKTKVNQRGQLQKKLHVSKKTI